MSGSPRPSAPTVPAGPAAFAPVDVVQLLALSSMWGLSFLFVEVALRDLGPLWIVAGRTTVGGVVLVTIGLVGRRSLPRGIRLWADLLVLGILSMAAPWTILAWAQQTLPSGLAGLLMAIVPTSTLLVAAAVGLERITARRVAGLLLALAGVGVIVAGGLEQPGRVLAVLVVVFATLMYASGAVYAKRRVSGRAQPLGLAAGQVLASALIMVPVAVIVEGPVPGPSAVSGTAIGAVVLLGLFGTGFAFVLFYSLVARVGATNATLTTYLIPVVAVMAGAVVLGERLGPEALAGGALILVGIWLAQRVTPTSRAAVAP